MSVYEPGIDIVHVPVPDVLHLPTLEMSRPKWAAVAAVAIALTWSAHNGGAFDGGSSGTPHVYPTVYKTVSADQNATAEAEVAGLPCESWIKAAGANERTVAATRAAAQQHIVANHTAPGGAVAIGCGNTTVSTFTVGSTGNSEKISADTTEYDIASVTKMITGMAILKLQDEGKLSLADKVSKYYPNEYSSGVKESVTLEMLLQHRSGLVDPSSYTPLLQGATTAAQVQARFLAQPIPQKNIPGNSYSYSNVGMNIAAMIGAQAAGMPLSQYESQAFFKPLGMNHTGYAPHVAHCAPTSPDSDQAAVLVCTPQDRLGKFLGSLAGHDGIFTSAHDLGILMGMEAAGGKVGNTTYLSKAAIAKQSSIHYAANTQTPDSTYGVAARLNIAHGMSDLMSSGAFGHSGWSVNVATVDPETGLWSAVVTNGTFHKAVNDNTGYKTAKPITDAFVGALQP